MVLKRIMPTLLLLTLIVGGVFMMPVQHASAATCSGNGCNGQYPQNTGCDADGRTFVSAYIKNSSGVNIGLVELRGSPACGTNWSRVTSWIGNTTIIERVTREDGLSYQDTDNNTTQGWSPMVYAPVVKAQACGWIAGGAYGVCTAWF